MKIKKLMPMDAESRRLIDWMEKGNICLRQLELIQLVYCSMIICFRCAFLICLSD